MRYLSLLLPALLHLAVAYIAMMAARVAYVAENWAALNTLFEGNSVGSLLVGSLRFDTSAIMYTNAVVIVAMALLPCNRKQVVTWLFTIVNGLCLVMNLADAVYYQYTGRRTTMSVFSEFSNEGNLGKIFMTETLSHWYLFLFGIAMIAAMYYASRCIMKTWRQAQTRREDTWRRVVLVLLFAPVCIFGIRGGIGRAIRPITLSNANQYVARPTETAVVLNTPFSMLRTIGKSVFNDPKYFSSEEMERIYSPLHTPQNEAFSQQNDTLGLRNDSIGQPNVVVLIVESFGREYSGAMNPHINGGKYEGYTPFLDSLYSHSLTFEYSFANGRKSIDGMPSILSGIPYFVEPFFLTPAAMNKVSGIAGELSACGYTTAFFHGADNGSMGFEAFARATGFSEYYGRNEYDADKRFGGEKDFDGTWAIWDEPFMQFYAMKMSELQQPFVTTLFTASSHHPFNVPEQYAGTFRDEPMPQYKGVVRKDNPIHKCVRYTDMALRRFFDTARQQPWYENTIFVITADHTNKHDHEEYGTDLGLFAVPILFYDPSGRMPRGHRQGIAQQTDIMPTVLSYLRYGKPYIAFGKDLLSTPEEETWAVNYINGIYQYVKYGYVLQFDGQKTRAVYALSDRLMSRNLIGRVSRQKDMEQELKAVIQQYMHRMNNDMIAVKDNRE